MRTTNRLLCFVLGVGLASFGAVAVAEAIFTWTGSGFVVIQGNQWLSTFETTQWSSSVVIGVSVAVAVFGFLLLVAELRPERAQVMQFPTEDGQWLLVRRSTERHLERRLQATIPTSAIRVRLSARGRAWKLKVTASGAMSTQEALETAARAELDHLHAENATLKVVTKARFGHD